MDKRFFIESRRRVSAQTADKDIMLFISGQPVRKTTEGSENRSVSILTTIEEMESLMAEAAA